jgi:hypothetical protein
VARLVVLGQVVLLLVALLWLFAAACDFFADLPYCESLSISASSSACRAATFSASLSIALSRNDASSSMLRESRSIFALLVSCFSFGSVRELRLRETTILQLNLRIRAPFATTMDAGHESKGQA